jgi:hypothetical protein
LVELFSGTFDDARYGIATVQPSRAVKKCRIRNLRVEYGLSKIAVFLAVPKACVNCEKQNVCSDDFAEQIIQKYNDHHKDSDEFMSIY